MPENGPEGSPEPRRVEEVFQSYSPLLELRVGGRTIRTTAEHPFWVRGRGWTAAQELMAGDHLLSYDGRWTALEAARDAGESAPVYNMRVAEYHTYFVGAGVWGFAIWSHNADCVHRVGGGDANNLVPRPQELALDPPGMSVLRGQCPRGVGLGVLLALDPPGMSVLRGGTPEQAAADM